MSTPRSTSRHRRGNLLERSRSHLLDTTRRRGGRILQLRRLKQPTISLDAAATSTNTILSAINLEGTFTGALDLETDPTNDGTGIPGAAGTQGLLEGGTAEALQGRDVNPQTTGGVFDSFSRLMRALQGDSPDLGELERLGDQLDDDMTRINFALADIGYSRGRSRSFRARRG
ncbi:MAG: hypothetical protein R3B96_23970 [Pirellulaceae bacterium]